MKKRLLKLVMLLWLTGAAAYAQTVVSGKVISAADGAPIPGVSILVKGTSTGTSSDAEGKYSLNVPDAGSNVLVVSFIGFTTQEVAIGGKTLLDISLEEDITQLNEVVVTALGIERSAKTLVYATQSVKTSSLTEVRDANNVLNSLQGKVVNAQINQGSGGPGSGARIVLRGNRSIQGSNNALIVVDGVPINNNSGPPSSNSTNATNDFGSVQSSDGASSINPDDIESMTILRGASAAALYGSQAGNGVIVITTKKGTKENVSVTINSGIQTDTPFQLPDVQNQYGQGSGGQINTATGASWGAKMDGQSFTTVMGDTRSYSPQKNNIRDFFRTGVTLNNSVGVSGGSAKMQTYLSYTNNKTQGIIPHNDLTRHTINLRISNQISEKLSTDAKVTYINQVIENRPRTGEENAPVIDVYQMPRSMSNADAKNYQAPNSLGVQQPTAWPSTLSSIYQNPYWMVNNTSINEHRDRIMGFISAKYKFTSWLNVTGRANLDKTTDLGDVRYQDGTILWTNSGNGGYFGKSTTTATQQWYDLILEGENKLSNDFKLSYHVGGIWQDTRIDFDNGTTQGLQIPNVFSTNFAANPTLTSASTGQRTQSIFGQFSLAFKEGIFLEGSLRTEWDSRLPSPYYLKYPSVGLSGVISDLVTLPNAISFLKANINYAEVGNGGLPQLRTPVWNFSQGAGNGNLARSTTEAIPALSPEIVKSLEFGVDAKFLGDRVGITATYYESKTTHQLLKVSVPIAIGYIDQYINAGQIDNHGLEIVLNGTPIKSEKFTWDVGLNFGMNRNKIVSLAPNSPIFYLGGNAGNGRTATPVVQVGGRYGDLISKKWKQDSEGRHIVDANGLPVGTDDQTYLGNFNPKALLGLTNSFTFGRFSARVLIDGRVGGVILDGTEMNLAFSGISKVTEKHRDDNSWTLGGVNESGTVVEKTITPQQFWSAGSNSTSGQRYGVGEFFAYNATNFRVRELSVGYSIPVPSVFFIKSARISFIARNLFWLYRGSSLLDIPGIGKRKLQIDPDMALGNGNYQGVQYATLPSTRSLGFNVKLTF